MPWDSDVDVQVSLSSIYFLAQYYNMTVYTFNGRNYLLEINPQYTNASADSLNMIDGRYIDTITRLFIDVTTVRTKHGSPGILYCKDRHQYQV